MTAAQYAMAQKCDAGCLRSYNEDAVATYPNLGFMIVADGMGGHNSGDTAARTTIDIVEKRITQARPKFNPDDNDTVHDVLTAAFTEADQQIRKLIRNNPEHKKMGCTAASVLIHDKQAHIAHLGDSRVYLLRNNRLRLLTRDHSPAQRMADTGIADEASLAASHNRHVVNGALGASNNPQRVEVHSYPIMRDDLLLACTDGLNDMLDGADIEVLLNTLIDNLPLAAEQLVMAARDCGGYDNISVALIHITPSASNQANHHDASLLNRMRNWFSRN